MLEWFQHQCTVPLRESNYIYMYTHVVHQYHDTIWYEILHKFLILRL